MKGVRPRGLTGRPSATGKDRIAALDGVRALALIATMGFHFGVGWLQGGFFGLDIFFVLSGFLITGLLLGEYRRHHRIRLLAFWGRRARRLLPALLIVLVAVILMVRFAEPAGLYPDFRMSSLSALFYFSNWWQIAASSNYFVATGATSPLTHTWSLAVEEQFYLVWPLVVLAIMHLSSTFIRAVRVVLVVSVAGAVASAVEMAVLYSPTVNTTRLYFGTDTHAQSILIGAVLACVMTMVQLRRGNEGMAAEAATPLWRSVIVAVGMAGLVGTAILATTLNGYSSFDYQGGITLSALSAAAIILGAVGVPDGPVSRLLSTRPLVFLGTISYGAYLWHFPVAVFVDPSRFGVNGFALLVLRSTVTVGLATVSFVVVERPVMERTFWRSAKAIGPALALMGATVVVIVAGTVVPVSAAVPVVRFGGVSGRSAPPVVVVLGDSTALTLSFALSATAPAGTTVQDGSLFGCGLIIGSFASRIPPTPQLALTTECNEATPASGQWPAHDAEEVASTRAGDVVLFLAGTWEVQDILRNGRWTNIEQPSDQLYLVDQLRTLVRIATAHGAHLELATLPALSAASEFKQPPFPEDSPIRRDIYNRLIRKVAADFPDRVSVIDYGGLLSPRGVFTFNLNGVQVRTIDGVHTPSFAPGNPYAGNVTEPVAHAFYNWISPRIWPLIIGADHS